MKILVEFDRDAPPDCPWYAIDDGTYDGAPDSPTRGQIGWGRTRLEAIEDLFDILEIDDDE